MMAISQNFKRFITVACQVSFVRMTWNKGPELCGLDEQTWAMTCCNAG